jgi:hypothetical protein
VNSKAVWRQVRMTVQPWIAGRLATAIRANSLTIWLREGGVDNAANSRSSKSAAAITEPTLMRSCTRIWADAFVRRPGR